MKRVLYLIRRRPGVLADETIDMALVSGVFEQQTSALFMDDGVYQLSALEDRQSSVKALPTYDVGDIYVAADSLTARRIAPETIDMDVRIVDAVAVRRLLATHDIVVSD